MANPTVAQLIARARVDLNDTDADAYRYETSDLLGFVNSAVLEIWRNRPDFFYGESSATQYVDADVTGSTEYRFPQFADVTVRYVVGRAEIRDDEFTNDGRAAQMLQMFSAAVTGVL